MRKLLYLALLLSCLTTVAHAVQCGRAVIGASGEGGQNLEATLMICTPIADGTVDNQYIYMSVPGTSEAFGIAVVDSDGTGCSGSPCKGGEPNTLICQASALSATLGWNIFTPSGCGTLLAGHKYYLVRNFSGADQRVAYDGGSATGRYFSQTCCTFVNFPGSPSVSGSEFNSEFLNLLPTSSTAQCGITTVGSSGTSANTTFAATQCTPFADSVVTDCKAYTFASGQLMYCGVYDSDGTVNAAGSPHTLLCVSASTATVAGGWVTLSPTGCPTLLKNHNYWIGLVHNGTPLGVVTVDYGYTSYYFANTTLPNPYPNYGGGANLYGSALSAYLDLSPAGTRGGRVQVIQSQ